MIKIAIAGTNGLAQYIAHFISSQTSHQFVILSRKPSPGLTSKGWQVIHLDYANPRDLKFKLAGVDTVVSTISGSAQLALIDAAAAAHVRRFVPSEFGGPPSLRPHDDLLDNNRHAAILRLHQLESTGMRFTVFTCGIFMERFGPGGMAASQIGIQGDVGREGRYLVDMRQRKAQIPHHESTGQAVSICITSARDVARFVVAAIDLNAWPREFRMCAERINVKDLVKICEQTRGRSFEISNYTRDSLQDASTYARAVHDLSRQMQLHYLMATADRRFDFRETNLNQLVSVRPERFRDYMARVWAGNI